MVLNLKVKKLKTFIITLTLLLSLNLFAGSTSFNGLKNLPIGESCPPCEMEIRGFRTGVMSMKKITVRHDLSMYNLGQINRLRLFLKSTTTGSWVPVMLSNPNGDKSTFTTHHDFDVENFKPRLEITTHDPMNGLLIFKPRILNIRVQNF